MVDPTPASQESTDAVSGSRQDVSAPEESEQDATTIALAKATEASRQEAMVRGRAIQQLLDQGYSVVNSAYTDEGQFYFEVVKDGSSVTRVNMSPEGALTTEGKQ